MPYIQFKFLLSPSINKCNVISTMLSDCPTLSLGDHALSK